MTICERFRKKFIKDFDGCSALVLSESNRLYLTRFASSDGAVLITPAESYLIVDFRYYEMAKNKCSEFKVVLADKGILKAVKEICEREGISSIVLEDNFLTVSQNERLKKLFENFSLQYFGNFIEDLRAIKTAEEIRMIKASQQITDEAFTRVLNFIRRGVTENDVAAEIEYFFKKNGAEPAFKTIAVSGTKSACPHGEPSNVILTENSFLTMDFGAKLDGYCSDMTRTVVLGKANDEMKDIYEIVLQAQKNALFKIKSNVLGSEVDLAARDFIKEKGYGHAFGHATGHSLGIDVHESPSFSINCNNPILKDTVLSVEPGIYLEGKYGVRIEDIVVINDNGCENLTQSDKNLIEII